jgi:hypothetical protein
MSKGCDITDFIEGLMNEKNPDGTRKFSDLQIKGKLKAALKSGLISKEQLVATTGQKDLLITDSEWDELEALNLKAANANKPLFEALTVDEVKRLVELANKARNSIGFGASGKIDNARLVSVIEEANALKPTETVELLDSLDRSIDRANRNNNKRRAAELMDLKNKLMAMNDLSSRLKIDWNGIAKTNKQIEKLLAELATIQSILEVGDRTIAQKRKELSLDILNLRNKQKAIGADASLSDEEKDKLLFKNEVEIQKLIKELSEITSDKFEKANKRLRKRLKTVKVQIQRLQDNAPNSFFNRVVLTLSGTDPNFYITSLRELKRRQTKTKDDIALVRNILDKHPDDKQYTMGDIQNLFGEDITSSRAIKHFFYEKELNDDGTPKLDSSSHPILKKKDSITKKEAEQIFIYWENYKKSKTYESSITTVEATNIRNQLLASDKKLPEEVNAMDPLPTARTRDESLVSTLGYRYNPKNIDDRVRVVQDLHSALQRLSYVTSLASFDGVLSEGMLIGILGTDAQSLLHKFDPAIADDLELDNPYVPSSETTREGRLAALQSVLGSLGYTDAEIHAMPEFTDVHYVDNFSRVVSVDLEWEPNTNNIIAASIVEFHGGKPVHSTVVYSKTGNTNFFTQEDAQDLLNTMERYQNNGFKVVGHNFLGEDSDMQKLVSVSKNTKQGLAISYRLTDTMLLSFRNSPTGNFSRRFGPSLSNLAKAFGLPGKTMSGENAYTLWKDGNLKDFEAYILEDSVKTGSILMEMVHKKGSTVEVENRGRPQSMFISDVVPMWYDTGKPESGRNPRYNGSQTIFDVQSFRNYRVENGHGMHNNLLYEAGKVRNIMVNIILSILRTDKPEEIENILRAVNAREKDVNEQIDTLLEISRLNQEAYLPVLREMRKQNGNEFILAIEDDGLGNPAQMLTKNSGEYEDAVINEFLDTLSEYNRGSKEKTLKRFANKIGFREPNTNEELFQYAKSLFEYAANKFNDRKNLKITSFGDGSFDYVPALQLGRGFAQIVLGHIEDGVKLSQSIKTPIEEIDKRRELAKESGKEIEFTSESNLVQKREFLPITKQNVSFFAPLSMYEQERAYDDFALRERYFHILNRDITDDDLNAFEQWRQTDRFVEFKNAFRAINNLKNEFRKGNISSDVLDETLVKYFGPTSTELSSMIDYSVSRKVLDYSLIDRKTKDGKETAATLKKEILENLNTLTTELEEEHKKYVKSQDFARLEQGRIQRYSTVYQVNNRDIYTRIPTIQETEEMALELALDLPSLAAIFVHDSITSGPEEKLFLNGETFWNMPEMSSGGPTGAALLSGIHPQLAWLMNNPEVTEDPELMKKMVLKSFENGREVFTKRGYSRTTYWDDNMSGLHHILMLLWSYSPGNSFSQEESILQILDNTKTGNVGKSDLTDYYIKTAEQFERALDILRENAIKAGGIDSPAVKQIEKIQRVLSSSSKTRDFFKGAVIPILYTGGYPAVLEGLRKKKEKIEDADPIAEELTEEDLQLIAKTLTTTGAVVKGRLIDEILGLDSNKISKLMELFDVGTTKLTRDVRKRWIETLGKNDDLSRNIVSIDAARAGIKLRLRYIAELTMPPKYLNDPMAAEDWIAKRVAFLENKWQDRISKAETIVRNARGGKIEIGSQDERNFHIALAGDEAAFKTQMTLIALNQMQASGLKLNSSDRDILEASVMTGRYVAPDDLMYTGHIVYTMAGIGTGSGRAQYINNYLTNLHGSRLSKATRLVFKEDGTTVDWDETVSNSAWSLVGNQFAKLPRSEAIKKIRKETMRSHLLTVATDYPPTMIGYNTALESRQNFFSEWADRTERETEWEKTQRLEDVEKLKKAYADEGRPQLTDEMIEKAIASNSTPMSKRIRTRVIAPASVSENAETIMTTSDAKGLAAFRPRLADNPFEDRIISGLYSIYQGVKKLETGVGSMQRNLQRLQEEGTTPEKTLDMENARGSMYDADQLGVYFPEMDSTILQELFGYEPTFNQRRNQLKFLLERFAVQHGLEELVKAKEYARLYQIYKIRQSFKKFSSLLSQGAMSEWEMRFLHRHFVQQVFKLTKAQRDATNSERNILDFSKAIAIDPSKFRYEDGSNMMWLDVLGVLADLGIEELGTLEFGMAPTELLTTSQDRIPASVLKSADTSVLPNVVQGRDVALILQGIFANLLVKQRVKKLVEEMKIPGVVTDPNTGYVLVSSLPVDAQRVVLEKILNDDDLIFAAAQNLGLHVTIEFVAGKNMLRFQNSKFHSIYGGGYVTPRQGLGDPSVSRTVQGEADVKFFLTPEAIKRILTGARNSNFFNRLETSVAVFKSLGGPTRVDQLRRDKYGEFLEQHLEEIAEETELLDSLHEGTLERLGTTRLKDELGLTLDLYDAEKYFLTPDDYTNMTPFMAALTLDIRVAMERAKKYPALQREFESLQRLMTLEENEEYRHQIAFIISIKNNLSREITDSELRILVSENFGTVLTDDQFETLMIKAEAVSKLIDKINHSPFKGKNKYLALAVKYTEMNLSGIGSSLKPLTDKDINSFIREVGVPSEEHTLAAQALKEVHLLSIEKLNLPEAFADIPSDDLIRIATDSTEFENAFPEGRHINNQLTELKTKGIIDDQTEMFYRFLISKLLKHNPNLAKYLSISVADLGSAKMATAVKDGDRFIININTNIMKNMGRIDQVRIFAHEIAHIARLAFIRDNGPEWRKLEALFRSQRGRNAMEGMLLLMNNNKKYIGFEDDLRYYRDNPEEFIAQWGSWMLMSETFDNVQVMKKIQSMSRDAFAASKEWERAFNHIKYEVMKISFGLAELDEVVFNDIIDITESMFGFTASSEREIFIDNENKTLMALAHYEAPISSLTGELDELNRLTEKKEALGFLPASEETTLMSLQNKFAMKNLDTNLPFNTMNVSKYYKLRRKREAEQGFSQEKPAPRFEPATGKVDISKLNPEEREEMAITALLTGMERIRNKSISTGTLGGLSRQAANKMFGERAAESFFASAASVMSGGLTQSRKTYQSDHPVARVLMHIIGEGFSIHQHQFLKDTGSRSIRENRAYAQQWAERLVYETGQLQSKTTKDEFEILMKYAFDKNVGIHAKPVGISPEKIAKADEVAFAIGANNRNMVDLIYGDGAQMFSSVPTGFNRSMLGARKTIDDENKRREYETNRQELIDAVADQIVKNVMDRQAISSSILYVSGLAPRIQVNYSQNEKGIADLSFLEELNRVKNENPATFDLIVEIAVRREVERTKKSEATVRSEIRKVLLTAPKFEFNGTGRYHSVLFNATHELYRMVDSTKNIGKLIKNINKINAGRTIPNMRSELGDRFQQEVELVINSRDPVSTDIIFNPNNREQLPAGVSNITRASTIQMQGTNQKTLKQVVAALYLSDIGDHPTYLEKNALVNTYELRENPKIARFLNNRADQMLVDIERSKGFRATSRIAIQDITGISGIDIYDLIALMRSTIQANPNDNRLRAELEELLKVIEQKLEIEQGISSRSFGEEDDYYVSWLLKWGPDITRLAYGPNLNTASLIMEGTLGVFITMRYGGNGLEFARDLFGGLFGNLGTKIDNTRNVISGEDIHRYNPRGLAINLMRGIEHSTRNARDLWHFAQDYSVDSPNGWDRFKAVMSRIHNSAFESLSASLSNQAQQILVENMNNGNLFKIRDMFNNETITNLDELKQAMNRYNIRGILPHMVYELKLVGMFEPKVIETFNFLLNNVSSSEIKNGTLDLIAANKWIESHLFTPAFVKDNFDETTAYRTVAAIYNASKAFRNIVVVENNPWDMATHNDGIRYLMNFYRQFPNMFFAQKVVRMSNKMDISTFATFLIATTILDILYNSLLLVALGALPITALLPFHEDFLFTKNPLKTMSLIASRNPIFGITGNMIGGAAMTTIEGYVNTQKYIRSKNQYQDFKRSLGKGYDEFGRDMIPMQAIETISKDPITMMYVLMTTGGNLNEQETHDFYNALINQATRFVPIFGELPVRISMNKLLLGDRPKGMGLNLESPERTQSTITPYQPKESPRREYQSPFKPIQAPSGLFNQR